MLVTLLLSIAGLNWSREAFRTADGPPAFSVSEPSGIPVLLECDLCQQGVYHFFDGALLRDVILMTGLQVSLNSTAEARISRMLEPGNRVVLEVKDGEIKRVCVDWMPAVQRLALGIPLHPDRMSLSDWEVLPGIGPRLAERIDMDRQNNGEFGVLQGLLRVKGIGPGRILEWRHFFSAQPTH